MSVIVKPRRPSPRNGWMRRAWVGGEAWQSQGLLVLSQIADVETNGVVHATWIVSVTSRGVTRRATDDEMKRVRAAFGMQDAEEDNHYPGRSRAMFLVVDPRYRVACECKVDETTVVEPDGYRWQDDGTREATRGAIDGLWGDP